MSIKENYFYPIRYVARLGSTWVLGVGVGREGGSCIDSTLRANFDLTRQVEGRDR